jgi:hypothetical protein
VIQVSSTQQLVNAVVSANSGDTIELAAGNYTPTAPLTVSNVTGVTIEGPQTGSPGAIIAGFQDLAGTQDLIDVQSGASLTLRNLSLRGTGAGASFGAVYAAGGSTVVIENSEISGNNATGIVADAGSDVTIRNSTIALNSHGGSTGGIGALGTVHVFSSTIAQNDFGIDLAADSTVEVVNSIVADNKAASAPDQLFTGDCALTGTPLSFTSVKSFDTDGKCHFDLPSREPLLGPFNPNGGSTLSFAPLPRSPAIDAGSNAGSDCPAVDQRYAPRTDGRCDIGAIEVVGDTTAPTINVPAAGPTVEATGPSGAPVSFLVTATDDQDPNPVLSCAPASGSIFPVGSTTVTCNAHDAAGNAAQPQTFTVTVTDTTPPQVTVPQGVTAVATSGTGATVTFEASATDLVDGSLAVTCNPSSGSVFALGQTQVTCSATDHAGNTGTASFRVSVNSVADTEPPVIAVPTRVVKEATGPQTPVGYTVTATDNLDPEPTVSCSPESGSSFPLGDTTVTCSAHDGSGNKATPATFTVTVVDTTTPSLVLPPAIEAAAGSSPETPVVFTALANDLVDGTVPVTCAPGSGTSFPVGTTRVDCTATDAHGNTAQGSFSVTIVDATPPVIRIPDNIEAEAAGPGGAAVGYTVTATDNIDPSPAIDCSPASGSLFPLGATTVTCTARDAAGNTTDPVTFTVNVVETSVSLRDPGGPLRGTVGLIALPTLPASRTTASIVFEWAPAGSNVWSPIAEIDSPPYRVGFDTTTVPDGDVDLRARLRDSDGGTATSEIVTTTIRNDAPLVVLADPGRTLSGTAPLSATASTAADQARAVTSVTFQLAPAGTGAWTTLATVATAPYRTSFDTTAFPDGSYDLRVTATDSAGATSEVTLSDIAIANDAPSVTLEDPGYQLADTQPLAATADAPSGRSVSSVTFQYAPAGTNDWTTIAADPTAPYTAAFVTTSLERGLYDLRAVALDSTGATATSPVLTDRIVNPAGATARLTIVPVRKTVIRNTITLSAEFTGGEDIVSARFEYSLAGTREWTPIDASSAAPFDVALDTTALSDGDYAFRVVGSDQAGSFVYSPPLGGFTIDNTPPNAALRPPGTTLTGRVTLIASAEDGASGVASVRFERAVAGTGTWVPFGSSLVSPYSLVFNTATAPNGLYDLRVVATDMAGNTFASRPVTSVAISNPPVVPPPTPSIANTAAPAHDIGILGITNNASHEAWAYGFTSAPPAEVDGKLLPYTTPGNQLVLLRYTDETGWEIADVLRNADGSAFPLWTGQLSVKGGMAATGEAWIWISGQTTLGERRYAIFHREPGAQFLFDADAAASLGPELLDPPDGGGELTVRTAADGTAYGLLLSPGQQGAVASLPAADGTLVPVFTKLSYGLLVDGTWTSASAPVPPDFEPKANDTISLAAADVHAAGAGYGALSVQRSAPDPAPAFLGAFAPDGTWTYRPTGADAFDATGALDTDGTKVLVDGLYDAGGEVWLSAQVQSPDITGETQSGANAILRYDTMKDGPLDVWCSPALQPVAACPSSIDLGDPATLPTAVFPTANGPEALALSDGFVDVFSQGEWTRVAAPGFLSNDSTFFAGPNDGWLAGQAALGHWTLSPAQSPLVSWPEANRSPLTAVALPPGSDNSLESDGAIAVGLSGTAMHFEPGVGWVIDPVPPRLSHINLNSVAYSSPTTAVAVGQFGAIMRWDGSSWSEDEQSISLTQAELNAVAFAPTGEGWAVGTFGTILHFDGKEWSLESPPPDLVGLDITSVAVAGTDVFAVAGGTLIERSPNGTWADVDPALMPTNPAPRAGDLRVVAALPDGGVVAAGRALVLVRQQPGTPFQYAPQPIEGTAVAAAAIRDANGLVGAYLSVAPLRNGAEVSASPPGDGDLLREAPDGGWQDMSLSEYPGTSGVPPDGAVKADPILGIATSHDGARVWAVGGYAGSPTAAGQGSSTILPARSTDWYTSSIWRFDATGQAAPLGLEASSTTLDAQPKTVSFAFFSGSECNVQCAATLNAQPDVNLQAAAQQIATYARQPGGPSFAILGGNARGPIDDVAYANGSGAFDLSRIPTLLKPLGPMPLFAAYGPRDSVPSSADPTEPWATAFAAAPAPFGSGTAAAGITPAGSGGSAGVVHRYYAFDAEQNGGTLRVIVLDNSAGSLEDSAPGQTAWLNDRLADAKARGIPVVAVAGQPLRGSAAADATASLLADAGVLAVFTGSNTQLNEHYLVPTNGVTQIPEYEGATLGYQQSANNGVVWYRASVNTGTGGVSVEAVPVIDSLSIKPLDGLSVARSFTLQFEAVARRPVGSLPPTGSDSAPGIANYVAIPSAGCGSRPCVQPTYTFRSSDPTIGDFVTPSGPGSRFPQLDASGKPIPSATSGLFCAYNTGTTTISVTTGLLSYSVPVL